MKIQWKEYFDNACKGEDMWGHYRTANGSLYVVADGASNHDGSMTGADVIRLIHQRLREEAANLHRSSDIKDLMYAINTESTRVNAGAYAAIAGVLHRGSNLYAFSAGDVSIIAKKVNEKLIQVLPLDLSMEQEEAERRARAEIGKTVNNISVTEENYKQRITQYMNHGLSNAVGLGEDFVLHNKYFDAKADTAMLIASDGVTDPFMQPKREAGSILQTEAEKFYEIFGNSANAEEAVIALENLIWDTRVSEKKKIKPDDRTGLFLYISPDSEDARVEKSFNSMSGTQLATELVKRIEAYKTASLDIEINMPIAELDTLGEMARELLRKSANGKK